MDPAVGVSPNTSRDLAALAKQLKQIDAQARKALPKRLRAAAKPMVTDANRMKPSSQIRVGMRVKLSGRNGASIKIQATSPKRPPLAGLFELGSKGTPGAIRHPTYGHQPWVSQPTRPYLAPAADRNAARAREELAKVIDDLAKTIGAR